MVGSFNKLNRFNYPPVDDLFTAKMGIAYPVRCIPVLPGDTWRIEQSQMARMLALLSPAYGKVCLRLHTFFVPYRVLWPKFYEGFMIQTKNDDGTLADPASIPTITQTWTAGSLGDYLGYPIGVEYTSTAFKVRAYQKIIRDWYLNTNIEDEYDISLSTGDGADATTSTDLFHSNYPRDYFTGTYPTRQRGEELPVPLSGNAPVVGTGMTLGLTTDGTNTGSLYNGSTGGGIKLNSSGYGQDIPYSTTGSGTDMNTSKFIGVTDDAEKSGLMALTANATSVNPSDFRLVWQLNLKRQKDLYSGSRTVDWLQEHYGVRCPDARLQRSEFLGGMKTYFNVSEVLQTSASASGQTAQGNMAGHGFSVSAQRPIKKTFTEHGVIMTILTISPQAVYTQGSPREDMKRTPEEFGLPVLSHTIMDAVYKGQVLWTGTSKDKEPLGYRNIYDEYRVMYSSAKGLFRANQSLEYWTWARKFAVDSDGNPPALNKTFIQVENNERPFATQDGSDKFLVKVVTKAKAFRKLPKVGTPLYLDHM